MSANEKAALVTGGSLGMDRDIAIIFWLVHAIRLESQQSWFITPNQLGKCILSHTQRN